MAATFTLPEELFNSMINSFNSNDKTEQVNIGVDQNKKNKTDGSNKTALDVTQKRRLGNVANVWFGDDLVKFFQSDFKKQIKQIEDIELEETKEKLEIIKKEEVKKVEEKKAKKKMSFKSMARKFRIAMAILNFIKKIYKNFLKFKEEVDNILDRNFKNQGFTLKGVLTNETERNNFIKAVKKSIKETATSFFDNMIMGSMLPLIELVIRLGLEKLLEVFEQLQNIISNFGEALEKFALKKSAKSFLKKMSGKLLGKTAAKVATKATITASLHTAAGAATSTGVGATVGAVIEVGLWAWTAYDIASTAKELHDAYQAGVHGLHKAGNKLISAGENLKNLINDESVLKYIDNIANINAVSSEEVLRILGEGGLSMKDLKVIKFNDLYEKYSDIDNIISEFDDETKFDKDEIEALSTMENKEKYRPYKFLISHYAKFFKKFKEIASSTFEIIKGVFPDLNLFADIKNIEINAKAKISKLYVNDDDEDDFRREPYKADNILKRNNKRLEIKLFNFNGLKYKKLKVHKNRTELFKKCLKVIKEVEDKRKKERLKTT